MKTQQFPNLPKAFAYMLIHDQLQLVSDKPLLGMAVRYALYLKQPISQIIGLVMHEYQNAPEETTEVIGEDTMKLILQVQ